MTVLKILWKKIPIATERIWMKRKTFKFEKEALNVWWWVWIFCSSCETISSLVSSVWTWLMYVTHTLINKINNNITGALSSNVKPFPIPGPDYRGIAITLAVLSVSALISVLIWFLYRRNRFHWAGFSSVRYEQGVNEDEIMLPSFHD